ncbi:hypothetical protein [Streptomyces dysideae]|uniref:hypothetical protein n=1 Tax=Streptomyces dysideae TaxID=909626 RepID=UPI001F3A21AC|nr:hypothetical protein [Streptomyces dysideae]
MLAEWPLVLAALPTTLLLCGAGLGWGRSQGIEYVAFGTNTVLLLCWGLLACRAAGRTWGRAFGIGCTDALLGVAVALASTLLKERGDGHRRRLRRAGPTSPAAYRPWPASVRR